MFRLLGWVARFGAWSKGLRGHGIAPHLVVMVLCLFGFLMGLGNYLEASANLGEPQPLSPRQLFEGQGLRDYVELTGNFHELVRIPGEDGTTYALLQDESGMATLVLVPRGVTIPPASRRVKVRGMLSYIGPELEKKLPLDPPGLRLNRNQVLTYGQSPPGRAAALGLMLLTAPCGLLLMLSQLSGHLIFRPLASTDQDPPPQEPDTLRISARLERPEEMPQDYLEVRGRLRDWTLEASITRSTRVLGITREEAPATWSLEIDPKSLKKIQAGTLFMGKEERPALRFSCQARESTRRQKVTLSFNTAAQRRYVWEKLTSSSTTP